MQTGLMKDAMESFCNGLHHARMLYHTSERKLHGNVLLCIYLQVVNLADTLLKINGVGGYTWLLPEGRRHMAAALVKAIGEEQAVDGITAKSFICKMEQLLAPFIDVVSVVSHFHSGIPLQFSICLKGDTLSSGLLETMIKELPSLWQVLSKRISGEQGIKVTCNEPFMNYSSECAILAQFLLMLREHFHLGFREVECCVSGHARRIRKFGVEALPHSYAQKEKLLHDILVSAFKVPVTVKRCNNISMEPCITLSNANFELKLWFDHGIAYWWKALRGNEALTYARMLVSAFQDMELTNMATQIPSLRGINITILYTPLVK